MTTARGRETRRPPRRGSHAAAARLITRVAIAAVTISVIAAGIPWLIVITPRWLARGVSIVSLWAIFGFFLTAVPTAVVAAAWSWVGLLRAWRRRDLAAVRGRLRWVALATSGLVSLAAMELIAGVALWRSYEIPHLPTRFSPAETPLLAGRR